MTLSSVILTTVIRKRQCVATVFYPPLKVSESQLEKHPMPRLDKHIRVHTGTPQKAVRLLIAQGRISVDGIIASDAAQVVGKFSHVTFDGCAISLTQRPHYLMFHKPKGVVCATRDAKHQTVLGLINHPNKDQLHIAGRLDYNSTGLVLLTNDGQWSKRLSDPESGFVKRYRVTTEQTITTDCVDAFSNGIYFDFEGLTTRPATLKLLDAYTADVALTEGRYHQIKRMFGRFDNKVLSIHRISVGRYKLGDLEQGEYLELDPSQMA